LVKWLIKIEKETNMTTIEIDIAYDILLGDFLEDLEQYQGQIESFIANGPGGGNPCLTIAFPSQELAESYVLAFECGLELADVLVG
jgi:hypothetical protein